MAELEEAGWSKTQEKPKEELTNKVEFEINILTSQNIPNQNLKSNYVQCAFNICYDNVQINCTHDLLQYYILVKSSLN